MRSETSKHYTDYGPEAKRLRSRAVVSRANWERAKLFEVMFMLVIKFRRASARPVEMLILSGFVDFH